MISANDSFYIFFHTKPENTLHKFIYELGNGQWDIPELRKLLEDILPGNKKFDDFEVTHDFPATGRKKMILNARQILQDHEGTKQILLAFEDVTVKN